MSERDIDGGGFPSDEDVVALSFRFVTDNTEDCCCPISPLFSFVSTRKCNSHVASLKG